MSKRWPLKRSLELAEWNQVVRALVLRRVPAHVRIELEELRVIVRDDLRAGIAQMGAHLGPTGGWAAWLEDADSFGEVIDELRKRNYVKVSAVRDDPNREGYQILGVTSTPKTRDYFELITLVVRRVVDFMPTTHIHEWMAYEYADGLEADRKTDQEEPDGA